MKPKGSKHTEYSATEIVNGKWHNFPTVARSSGKMLSRKEALKRAIRQGLLGKGYATQQEAVSVAKKRSFMKSVAMGFPSDGRRASDIRKAPQVTGGRRQRLSGRQLDRTKPYNPGGREPR